MKHNPNIGMAQMANMTKQATGYQLEKRGSSPAMKVNIGANICMNSPSVIIEKIIKLVLQWFSF
jgi:hypothetical protein